MSAFNGCARHFSLCVSLLERPSINGSLIESMRLVSASVPPLYFENGTAGIPMLKQNQ